ncbi:MAG: Fur family transcriptional regulator [Thiovulaceae bacterium]|nr:Fur family transcriptional regulator [Sulfurimonadaceae bacterium]
MNYENLLRGHGLKVTPQRLGILSLMDQQGHMNVDDLYLQIKEKFASISLATMYKNINAMMSASIITEIKIPKQKSRFEIVKESHGHLLCQECGEFMDIELDIAKMVDDVSAKSSYQLFEASLVLSGICPLCQHSSASPVSFLPVAHIHT